MTIIPNYAQYIQGLAYSSLFDLNHTNQNQAQRQLTAFIFKLQLGQFEEILEALSDTVLTAFGSILLKNVSFLKEQSIDLFKVINNILKKWYQPQGALKRSLGVLQIYIQRTYGTFIGNYLKFLLQKNQKEVINQFLDSLKQNLYYRLFVYCYFIQSVSAIDSNISYVSFRIMHSNFQETYIGRLFDALFPYFMNISEFMDINELSFLQNELSVNDYTKPINSNQILHFSQNNRFTQIVFMLLEQIMTFKFNLSHKQYTDFEDYQFTSVSFPEQLLVTIVRKNFLDALYNVLLQLMKTSQIKYQQVCLQCLKKILLAKTSYLSRELQDIFFFKNMQGVYKLMNLISQNGAFFSRKNIIQIIQCNINFINAFGLGQLEKKIKNDNIKNKCVALWLQITRIVPIYLFNEDKSQLNSQNHLFLVSTDMLVSCAIQIKINKIKLQKTVYYQIYKNYTEVFLQKFIVQGSNILGSKKFNFQELKRSSEDFFSRMRILLTYNYNEFFNHINNFCARFFIGNHIQQVNVGNLLLLICELFRQNDFLEDDIFGKIQAKQQQSNLKNAAEILYKAFVFVISHQSSESNSFSYYNHIAIYFIISLTQKCVSKLTTGNDEEKPQPPHIAFPLYQHMKPWFGKNVEDEQFLLICLANIAKYIRVPGIADIQFVLSSLHQIIIKMKWHMGRTYFSSTQIYKDLSILFNQLCSEIIPHELFKLQTLLFKIITSLSFDDILEEYKKNIKSAIIMFKQQINRENWVKILYSLIGIFQSIEEQAPFSFFLKYLLKQINYDSFLQHLFLKLGFPYAQKYLIDILHLSWVIFSNKCNRYGKGQCLISIYSIVSYTLPYWNYCLQQQEIFNIEDALIQIYTGFITIIESDSLNICILARTHNVQFHKLLENLLRSICMNIESIDSSTQLCQKLFSLCTIFTQRIAKCLFVWGQPKLLQGVYSFIQKLIQKLTKNFEAITSGLYTEKIIQPILRIINNYFKFLRTNRQNQQIKFILNRYLNLESIDATQMVITFLKIAMECKAAASEYLLRISCICINLIDFCNVNVAIVIQTMGLKDEKDRNEFKRIATNTQQKDGDFDWISYQLKDWFKMQGRFTQITIDDY